MSLKELEKKHKELSKEVDSLEKKRSTDRNVGLWKELREKKKEKLTVKTKIAEHSLGG
jgi:hypothetical protein